jgi:bromodomain-containing protein 8
MVFIGVRDGVVTTTTEFERDMMQMCVNAVMFNREDTAMYRFAIEFMEFARLKIKALRETELLVSRRNSMSVL